MVYNTGANIFLGIHSKPPLQRWHFTAHEKEENYLNEDKTVSAMLSSLKNCASYPFFSIIHIPLSIEHSIHHSISSFCLTVSSLYFTLITTFFNFISSVHPITPLWPQDLRFYHLDLTVLSSFKVSGSPSLHVKFQAVIHKRQGAKGAAALEEFAKISHNRAEN